MFSQNLKISTRQINRLLFFEIFGISTLWLPAYLAEKSAGDGFFSILIGGVAAWLFARFAAAMAYSENKKRHSLFQNTFVQIIYRIFYMLLAAYGLYKVSEFCREEYLQKQKIAVIVLLIALLVWYAVHSGLECIGRVGEILFWVCLIPFLIICLLEIPTIRVEYLAVMGVTSVRNMIQTSFQVFVYFSLVSQILFLKESIADARKTARSISGWIVGLVLLNFLIYAITLGHFSAPALAKSSVPVLDVISMPGGTMSVLHSFRTIFSGLWTVSLVMLVIVCVHLGIGRRKGAEIAEEQTRQERQEAATKRITYEIVMIAIVVILTFVFFQSEEAVLVFERGIWYVAAGAVWLLPSRW